MQTVTELLEKTNPRAHKQIHALQSLVCAGCADCYVTTYRGTPCATHGSSNAAKSRAMIVKEGYTVVAEAVGPRAGRRRTEGHLCYIAYR